MKQALLSLILMSLSGLAAAAPAGEAQTPMLDKLKAIESDSHRSRIHILEEAERCIQAASTAQALRDCEQKEKQARERLREELRPRHQALRQEVRQWRQSRQTEATSTKP